MAVHDVIYIPGIGDTNPKGQRMLVATWRLWGVRPHVCNVVWADGEAFEPKLKRLLQKVDALTAQGHIVSLVGASAGGGAVLNVFAARQTAINAVVTICGKINHPETIGDNYRRKNPAFIESADVVPKALQTLEAAHRLDQLMSRYALFDEVVPKRDSIVPGARNKTVLSAGHAVTIAVQLLFGAPFYLLFLKRMAYNRAQHE